MLLICSMIVTRGNCQNVDLAQMNKDLKIAEDIISTLFDTHSDQKYIISAEPKATYISDFGIMITIGKSNHFYSRNLDKSFEFVWDDDNVIIENLHELAEQAEELARVHLEEIEDELSVIEDREEKAQRKASKERKNKDKDYECEENYTHEASDFDENSHAKFVHRVASVQPVNADEQEEVINELLSTGYEVMLNYFSDYAYLINQLDKGEKITMSFEVSTGFSSLNSKDKSQNSKLIGTVLIKDLIDYRNGKLDEEDFYERIEFVEQESVQKEPDLELISSIFRRLYKSDLATTYYTTSHISYERMENFGAIFKMKVYSSSNTGRDSYKVITQGKYDLSREERDQLVDNLYPQFEKELLQNILDYGRTIKCLEEDEILMFQVALTECIGCQMPEQIRVSLNMSDLKAYDKGQMSKEDVMTKFRIKKD